MLICYGTYNDSVLRLYDTTEGVTPALLHEVKFNHGDGLDNLYVYKYDDNRAIICYEPYREQREDIFAVSVENDEIEVGPAVTNLLSNTSIMVMEQMSNNKLLHFVVDTYSLFQTILTLNGLTLTIEKGPISSTTIDVMTNSPMLLKSLGNNKALFVFGEWGGQTTGYYRTGCCVVQLNNDNTVTYHNQTHIETTDEIPFDGCMVSNNKLALVVLNESKLSGYVLTVNTSNNTVTVSAESELKPNVTSAAIRVVENKTGEYVLVYNKAASKLSVNLTNNTISLGTQSTITSSDENLTVGVPISNRVFVAYTNPNKYLVITQFSVINGAISNKIPYYDLVTRISKATSKINGVAKNSGSAGDKITVYVLGGGN